MILSWRMGCQPGTNCWAIRCGEGKVGQGVKLKVTIKPHLLIVTVQARGKRKSHWLLTVPFSPQNSTGESQMTHSTARCGWGGRGTVWLTVEKHLTRSVSLYGLGFRRREKGRPRESLSKRRVPQPRTLRGRPLNGHDRMRNADVHLSTAGLGESASLIPTLPRKQKWLGSAPSLVRGGQFPSMRLLGKALY